MGERRLLVGVAGPPPEFFPVVVVRPPTPLDVPSSPPSIARLLLDVPLNAASSSSSSDPGRRCRGFGLDSPCSCRVSRYPSMNLCAMSLVS